MGTTPDELARMAGDPRFQALYMARCVLGDEEFNRIMGEVADRIGFHRVTVREQRHHELPKTYIPIDSHRVSVNKEDYHA